MARRLPEGISADTPGPVPPAPASAAVARRAIRPRSGARAIASDSLAPSRRWRRPKAWRQDAAVALRRGTLRAGATATLNQAADDWLEAANASLILNRSGDHYKPSALRGYEQALRHRILPVLGASRLSDIRRSDVQRLVNA
jgi:hypothetical protein